MAVRRLYRRFFDLAKYRVAVDQRGCGRARHTPSCEEHDADLVADIERLRSTWHRALAGLPGSWGTALSPTLNRTDRVTELVLRGIFLLRKQEIDWFYQRGASAIYPDAWEPYWTHIPEAERGDMLHAYHRRLTSDDASVRIAAAKAWSVWEGSTSRLYTDPELINRSAGDTFAEAFARIECHYFFNGGFMPEGQLLADVGRIQHIPGVIVQGRYDVVCPLESAWALHKAWPASELTVIPDAGHSAREPGSRGRWWRRRTSSRTARRPSRCDRGSAASGHASGAITPRRAP